MKRTVIQTTHTGEQETTLSMLRLLQQNTLLHITLIKLLLEKYIASSAEPEDAWQIE